MTGVSLTATIDDREILGALMDMVERMDRPEGFYRNVGEHMLRSTRKNFQDQKAPGGTPWKPLAKSTVRKRKSASPILTVKGYLRGSINYAATPQGVTIGTAAIYAAIHQLGGRIERDGRFGEVWRDRDPETGKRGNLFARRGAKGAAPELVAIGPHHIDIPARPFLGVSAEDEKAILRIAKAWLRAEATPSE